SRGHGAARQTSRARCERTEWVSARRRLGPSVAFVAVSSDSSVEGFAKRRLKTVRAESVRVVACLTRARRKHCLAEGAMRIAANVLVGLGLLAVVNGTVSYFLRYNFITQERYGPSLVPLYIL